MTALRSGCSAPTRPGPEQATRCCWRRFDTLLLYTDGLVEDGRRVVDDGAELRAVLAGPATLLLDLPCDSLLDRLGTGHADDDIALIAVRCTGNPHPAA